MFGNLVEHVVIETDTGADPHRRLAVKIDFDRNRRLAGPANMPRDAFLTGGGNRLATQNGQHHVHLVLGAD